jgi:hypothetical protein
MLLLKEKHKLHIYNKGNNKDSISIHNNVTNKGNPNLHRLLVHNEQVIHMVRQVKKQYHISKYNKTCIHKA